jgi:hypothetical protein
MTKAQKIHQMLAQHHEFLTSEFSKDKPVEQKLKNFAEHCGVMRDAHLAEIEECEKSATSEMPQISKVAPTVPASVRAVLRPGQTLSKSADVPPEFARFISMTWDE